MDKLDREIPLCNLDDLDEQQAIELIIDERRLFAIRKDNQLHAYWNICPHLGIPLNWAPDKFLDLDNALIQCSSHGALFHIDSGECIAGPCSGQSLQPVTLRAAEKDYFVTADQVLPPAPQNLREQALADLEDS